jgi:hypothetical protein
VEVCLRVQGPLRLSAGLLLLVIPLATNAQSLTPLTPVRLAYARQPSNALANAAISPAVEVVIQDASGEVVTSATNRVTISLKGATGLSGTLTVAAQNGIATFDDLTISAAGIGYKLLASSPKLTSKTSISFNINESVAAPPTVTTIESLGVIPASQAFNGLGFNLTQGNSWEFQLAAAAGATHGRFQCGWGGNENQTPPPDNTYGTPQYALQADCAAGLVSAATYGIHPTMLAAYGPPFHQILTVVVPSGASAGATSLTLQFASGVGGVTIASLSAFYDTILSSSNAYITHAHSYAGGLIIAVAPVDETHATVTLASGLTSSLPANTTTQYIINELLYPPALTSSPTDPSVVAFAGYASFLAGTIAAAGLTGEVELWNEPPWGDDPWDNRGDFHDTWPGNQQPGPQGPGYPNPGFVAALQGTIPPAGVTYTWAGTNKSGFNTVFNLMPSNTGVPFIQPATVVTTESFHPYGNNPEDSLWNQVCLRATINTSAGQPSPYSACNLLSTSTSNAAFAAQASLVQIANHPSWGIAHNITETGFSSTINSDSAHQARFIIRQFLGYQAAGVSPVEFYRLYDISGQGFGFVDPVTRAPLPSYSAIAGLMSDLSPIRNTPVMPISQPSIVSYSGTYPLDTVSMVGSTSGATANSILFALWQRSYTSNVWGTLASPAPAPVTIQLPAGVHVVTVLNLDTRAALSYTTSGQQVTFAVSDDPMKCWLSHNSCFQRDRPSRARTGSTEALLKERGYSGETLLHFGRPVNLVQQD